MEPVARGDNVNGKKVFIVGGGNSAGQAAMFFSNYAAEVKVLVRGEGLKLSMSQYLIGEIASKANIEVVPFTQIAAVEGEIIWSDCDPCLSTPLGKRG